MKIAQVSPLIEDVPPRLYGGTERIVVYLTDALTLFAGADSQTKAELASAWRKPRWRRLGSCRA